MALKLTNLQIERLREQGRHACGEGLYLQVTGTGTRSWLFRYQLAGRRREIGLGPYPAVGVGAARDAAMDCRRIAARGLDPLDERAMARAPAPAPTARLFSTVATEYIAVHEAGWRNPKSAAQWQASLDTHASAVMALDVAAVATGDVLAALTPIWSTCPASGPLIQI